MPWRFGLRDAFGIPLAAGLSDPAAQPKFVELAPNALDPGFMFQPVKAGPKAGVYDISARQTQQQTGLLGKNGKRVSTAVWGYGNDDLVSWPGRTIQVQSGEGTTRVK